MFGLYKNLICCLLIFIFTRVLQVTEEREVNQEIQATKYGSHLFIIPLPTLQGFKYKYCDQHPKGQVGVDGERGRPGAPGLPVSVTSGVNSNIT